MLIATWMRCSSHLIDSSGHHLSPQRHRDQLGSRAVSGLLPPRWTSPLRHTPRAFSPHSPSLHGLMSFDRLRKTFSCLKHPHLLRGFREGHLHLRHGSEGLLQGSKERSVHGMCAKTPTSYSVCVPRIPNTHISAWTTRTHKHPCRYPFILF